MKQPGNEASCIVWSGRAVRIYPRAKSAIVSSRVPTSYSWFNFLYRVKVYKQPPTSLARCVGHSRIGDGLSALEQWKAQCSCSFASHFTYDWPGILKAPRMIFTTTKILWSVVTVLPQQQTTAAGERVVDANRRYTSANTNVGALSYRVLATLHWLQTSGTSYREGTKPWGIILCWKDSAKLVDQCGNT